MDTLRLAVAPIEHDAGDFEVQIYLNDVEVTSKGAGLGMDPYAVLIPVNRFVATEEPRDVPVARCTCGVYGCGVTDATIVLEGDRVRWDWKVEVPMNRAVVFDAGAYEQELRRVTGDHSWETPERTAGRLVLSSIAEADLPAGLRIDWVGNDWRDPSRLQVCLAIGGEYQVFVSFDWRGHTPESLAAEVRRLLTTEPPGRWPAAWHAMMTGDHAPPAIAGPDWTRFDLGTRF